MMRLFFWGGPGHAGSVYGDLDSLLSVESALKRAGWKVIIFDSSVESLQPYRGYEKQYQQWKDAEA